MAIDRTVLLLHIAELTQQKRDHEDNVRACNGALQLAQHLLNKLEEEDKKENSPAG